MRIVGRIAEKNVGLVEANDLWNNSLVHLPITCACTYLPWSQYVPFCYSLGSDTCKRGLIVLEYSYWRSNAPVSSPLSSFVNSSMLPDTMMAWTYPVHRRRILPRWAGFPLLRRWGMTKTYKALKAIHANLYLYLFTVMLYWKNLFVGYTVSTFLFFLICFTENWCRIIRNDCWILDRFRYPFSIIRVTNFQIEWLIEWRSRFSKTKN